MSLTTKDLLKIESLIDFKLKPIQDEMVAIRNDIEELKSIREIIQQTHRFITIEFPLLSGRVDRHDVEIQELKRASR